MSEVCNKVDIECCFRCSGGTGSRRVEASLVPTVHLGGLVFGRQSQHLFMALSTIDSID